MLMGDIAVVAYAIAATAYGLRSGRVLPLVLGVCVLALIIVLSATAIAVVRFGLRLDPARIRRIHSALCAPYRRWKRPIIVASVVIVAAQVVRAVSAATEHDWLKFTYLTAGALVVGCVLWAGPSLLDIDSLERDEDRDGGRVVAP
jgi:hypothetical protein